MTEVVLVEVGVVVPPMGTCWLVTIGIESETLMTAFLFSDVSTCGLESTFTRFSDASTFSIAKNLSAANAHAVRPPAGSARVAEGGRRVDGDTICGVSGLIDCWARRKLPSFSAQSM